MDPEIQRISEVMSLSESGKDKEVFKKEKVKNRKTQVGSQPRWADPLPLLHV